MAFCNNANLLNVFVRHIANNQLRSLAEVATVAHQLKLLKDDFFASDQQAVAVADRGNDSNLLIVFYVQIMPDDFVMQLHRF